MKTHPTRLQGFSLPIFLSLTALLVSSAPAAVRYVNVNNTAPSSPYTTWATAATNIQDAVDVAVAGDEIAVTNGIYEAGQRVWPVGTRTNRLAITNPLKVYSVNGPNVTVIDGGGTNRCVYLAAGATLSGFALMNGFADKGGGLYCESNSAAVSGCVFTHNKVGSFNIGGGALGGGIGGGVYGGTLTNCTLTGNNASIGDGGGAAYATLNGCLISTNSGSGAYGCILNDCTIAHNSGDFGGGAISCTLNNCSLVDNYAETEGGGAANCTLNNCSLKYNFAADHAGGAWGGTLNNCTIANNTGFLSGGGARSSTLNNCIIANNLADAGPGGGTVSCTLNNCVLINNRAYNNPGSDSGGGACGGTLNNCTLAANQSAHSAGGGASGATLNNCILYFNTAPQDPNYDSFCTINYSCTTPFPTNGVGNFTNEPLFVDLAIGNLRLQPDSPCINAGNNSYVTNSTDLDGHPRILGGIVDVGCD